MTFFPISDSAARQSIDAVNIWTEYLRAKAAAQACAGGMYWKKEGAYEYLVKTLPGNKQRRMGARTEATEQAFTVFHAQKKAAEARLSSLSEALDEAQRMNKAVRAGRVPDIVVMLLNALEDAGLAGRFLVIGTHALFAYECSAGVRIAAGTRDAQGLDPLSDAKRGMEFLVVPDSDTSLALAALQNVDSSFQLRSDAVMDECAINGKGFEVGFWRLDKKLCDKCGDGLSEVEGGAEAMRARLAAVLSRSPLFSQPVISATGKLARMNTIDPRTFVECNRLIAGFEGRDAVKRRRDSLQAAIVQEMLQTNMLPSSLR